MTSGPIVMMCIRVMFTVFVQLEGPGEPLKVDESLPDGRVRGRHTQPWRYGELSSPPPGVRIACPSWLVDVDRAIFCARCA